MDNSEIQYNRVNNALMDFNNRIQSIDTTISASKVAYRDGCIKAVKTLQSQLHENSETEKQINAYINIARAHAAKLYESSDKYPIDLGALSRLAVQINASSRSDPYAEQLYTQASGMLMACARSSSLFHANCEHTKAHLKSKLFEIQYNGNQEKKRIYSEVSNYLQSQEFHKFIYSLHTDYSVFRQPATEGNLPLYINIGIKQVILLIPKGFESLVDEMTNHLYNPSTSQINIPVCINLSTGSGMIIDYNNLSEQVLLHGLQNIFINIAQYFENFFQQLVYIDPVRLNNSTLGIVQPLSIGMKSFIDNVPLSMDDIKKKLTSIIAILNSEEQKIMNQEIPCHPKRFLVIQNYPQGYDSVTISQIQQLFVNTDHYNLTIIATHNTDAQNAFSNTSLDYLRTFSQTIYCEDNGFYISNASEKLSFQWYMPPQQLPAFIQSKYIDEKPVINMSNDYEERLSFTINPNIKKGIRQLKDIPYGIDKYGKILTLDFENSNFATFICGASRSGKSTLLHTILTGIMKNNHPDDVEIWLIDFKMTEFSRYTKHLPPHVRYIILDESPELVYDIINRLSEILIKRQNIFKGKWTKLSEVPPEKYMPAIFVVIDEFSVMSQIIADSITNGKENYSIKLQTLLAKGAALGLHFIFSSQGFTSGTRGLSFFSKQQIQQRIAMKIDYSEIREFLDLKSASEDDKAMMEQLPVHYSLTRVPVDEHGNHLLKAKVLYFSDDSKQELMIDHLVDAFTPVSRYSSDDTSAYIYKQPVIIDGNNYSSFTSHKKEMSEALFKHSAVLSNGDSTLLFLGEPRRMLPMFPVEIYDGFCENILMIASPDEAMPAASIALSIAASLTMQNKEIQLWGSRQNELGKQLLTTSRYSFGQIALDIDEICTQIRFIKNQIQSKHVGHQFILLLGLESILTEMNYIKPSQQVHSSEMAEYKSGTPTIERRGSDEPDLNSQLAALAAFSSSSQKDFPASSSAAVTQKNSSEPTGSYDAKEDLKFILTQGPRFGYHFILAFNTVEELNQCHLDITVLKHKILFRSAPKDIAMLIGSSNAGIVSNLESHSFRYTNGLEAVSFRPYLHPGLTWDGWQICDGIASNNVDETEEYLM